MALFVVDRPLWFHLRGLGEKESLEIRALIVENGGKITVTDAPPIMTFTTREGHIPDKIEFDVQFIRDCVRSGRILDITQYRLYKPGPYDGCIMSLFLYQHETCKRFSMRSSTSRYQNDNYTAQENSNSEIQMARSSSDTINKMNQIRKVFDNWAAKIDNILPRKSFRGTQPLLNIDYFSEKAISCIEKGELSEHAMESYELNYEKELELTPTILVVDKSELMESIPNLETNMEESALEMPSAANDVLITNEDMENLILNDTECPALKPLRLTYKITEKLLVEESLIGETDGNESDVSVSSLTVSDFESHRNSTSDNVTEDKDAASSQNESALRKSGIHVVRISPTRCQKTDEFHSGSTNQQSPDTVPKTNVASRERLGSTSMNQDSSQANVKTNNDERTDKDKSGKIENMEIEMSDDNNDDIQVIWYDRTKEECSPLIDSTVESDSSGDNDENIVTRRKTLVKATRKYPALFKSSQTNIAKSKSQHETDTSKPSTSRAGTDIAKSKSQHKTDIFKPIRRTTEWELNLSDDVDDSKIKRKPVGINFEGWERRIMMRYLIRNDRIDEVRGLKVWQNMIDDGVLSHRTVGSLNNHFRKTLIKNVLEYKMPEWAKAKFRRIQRIIMKIKDVSDAE